MELLDVMKTRRSIRKYKPDAIPDEYVRQIIEAGRLAPSGTNIQPTRYIIILSAEAKAKLNECTPLPFVAEAPAVIACCIDTQALASSGRRIVELNKVGAFAGTPLDNSKSKDDSSGNSTGYKSRVASLDPAAQMAYLQLNAAIAFDHMTLRATDLGLGCCWVMMFNHEKLREMLELDDRYAFVALMPIGLPDQSPPQRPRLDLEELILKEI